ncbi:MAG: queuosine salvage family protein [Thermodesulfobacteriota bacterium]|nr:queuosine salvage family protein [Thermodesulfobacteriota bacterium]
MQIDKEALARFCQNLVNEAITIPSWNRRYHFSGNKDDTVSYLLVLDSLNFCFWPSSGKAKWNIDYGQKQLSGYYALAASLKKTFKSGIPVGKADYLRALTLDELRRILGGQGELQLMERRLQILHELGQVLISDFRGKASQLVVCAGQSAIRLARLLAEKLTSFQDVSKHEGEKVFFYKRAQIFAADLHGAFDGKDEGAFQDMDQLTAFADYKLPQVLRHAGILRYSGALVEKVDQEVLLEPGSPEEVEIRANTIWAVELIRLELEGMGKSLRAFEIDWLLWNLGQGSVCRIKPYHKTVTIFY